MSIPLDKCVARHVYRIHSRNLDYGVFDGNVGFVGLREKFGHLYLFTEDHYDVGAPHGTVSPQEDLGAIPDDIEVRRYTSTVDKKTDRLVAFDRSISRGGRGWYFTDTGESSKDIDPVSRMYMPLCDYLMKTIDPEGSHYN